MKPIPLIIINFNQLTYLVNLINWWQWFYSSYPIHIIDNGSTYEPLKEFYGKKNLFDVTVHQYAENKSTDNLTHFLHDNYLFLEEYEYYVISDPDIMPCPNVPPNFLEIFKHCIDRLGYNHVGFCLKIDDLPDHIDNKEEIIFNEGGFWNQKEVVEYHGKKYIGYKAPIDTTFAMYKKSAGWEKPMPPDKWSKSLRIFEAYHLMWYLSPTEMNPEMQNYFNTAKYRIPGVSSTGVNNYRPKKLPVRHIYYRDIVSPELLSDAVENREFHGFLEDYHVLHCLMRTYKPTSIFEVGTNMGTGTKILKNACMDAVVFTLDLPTELAAKSLQHPISEGKGDRVGKNCNLQFVQLRGDSMAFDFSQYPCEAAFIDGEHDYEHVFRETTEVLKWQPKIIVWHDSDIQGVYRGILDSFKGREDYQLFRVADTRMAYAVKS